jgi:POT family proton-dependent oligopeptide transporter
MGLGKSHTTTVNLAFTVAVNLLPLPASILVDGRLGRYKALQTFTGYYWSRFVLFRCLLTTWLAGSTL